MSARAGAPAARLVRCLASLLGTLAAAGCSLAEVAAPEAEDILVVEAVLRPDAGIQRILLHSSLISAASAAADGAHVAVHTETGRVIVFEQSRLELCIEDRPPAGHACYVSPVRDGAWAVPGGAYELEITTRDGRRAFGRTRVPGEFRMIRPGIASEGICSLPPDTPMQVVWSRSAGAWAYLADLEINGLREALAGRVPGDLPDQVNLTGLAIAESDTTLVLPGDFGIFQRTQFDQALLIALRDGLPAGAVARVVVAASDRNFVNAVRGGSFSPSGRVRIPSVTGDATGVFGSVTAQGFVVDVSHAATFEPCLAEG